MNQEPEYVDVDEVIQGTGGGTTELSVSPQKFEGMHFLSPTELPDLSEENAKPGISLTPKYYEGFIRAGDKVRCVFNGMTIIKSNKNVKPGNPPKEIPTVVFQNKDGIFLHSGANLVDQLRGFPPGNAIQITFTGKEKTGNGNEINKFDVVVLNVNPF